MVMLGIASRVVVDSLMYALSDVVDCCGARDGWQRGVGGKWTGADKMSRCDSLSWSRCVRCRHVRADARPGTSCHAALQNGDH